ncbi:hypothetical protein GL62_17360 [Salmonella enterica subsp. enterica]|nr:hypothetical protein A9G52_06960 [Salmonella enterica subsp. enterica serovar Worthington]EAA9241087.1 hypothetical protein [Salmonella enterica]ECT6440575.1 hypothetical protein [Salmonella enterica subsp. enterica]OKK32970.1 hypothetical protein BST89_16635 [Salmonella enterica subsp. enterica serovar Typhi]EAA9489908.1 hypothetical protein [Salmonella enterica]
MHINKNPLQKQRVKFIFTCSCKHRKDYRLIHSIIKIYKNSLYINSLITRRFHNTMNNAMSRI